jgi:hypothetical protein
LKGNPRLHGDDKQNTYKSKIIVVAIGAANTFQLMGLSLSSHIKNHCQKTKNPYTIPITKWLKASTWQELRDGEASFIAAGSGAAVATDILTLE